MASIGLLTSDPSNNAATACGNALVAIGHSVTYVADSDVESHDFSLYDVVVTSGTGPTNRAEIARVLTNLNERGTPLIIGPMEDGLSRTGSATVLTTEMLLTDTISVESGQTIVNVGSPSDHDIRGSVATGNNTLFSSSNWIAGPNAGSYIGTGFMEGTAGFVNTDPIAIAIESGTTYYNVSSGSWTGNRIVIFPTYLLSGSYTADHQTLLGNAVDWALAGVATAQSPVARTSLLTAYAVMDFPQAVGSHLMTAYAVMDAALLPSVGNFLKYDSDTWTNNPDSFSVQWLRDGSPITNATEATYRLVDDDAGAMISVRVIAINASGQSEPVESASVGPVRLSLTATSVESLSETGSPEEPDPIQVSEQHVGVVIGPSKETVQIAEQHVGVVVGPSKETLQIAEQHVGVIIVE